MSTSRSPTYTRTDTPSDLDAATIEELFADARRRALVRVLADSPPDTPIELDDLAARVAAAVARGPVRERTDECVLWGVFDDDLPLLEDAGLVAVDREDGIFVTPAETLDDVAA